MQIFRWRSYAVLLVLWGAVGCDDEGSKTSTSDVGLSDVTEGVSDTDSDVLSPTCELTYTTPQFENLQVEERLVDPIDLDPATDLVPDSRHAVLIATDRPLLDPLFVWIPGTRHRPPNNQGVLRIAAAAGYRTLGLAYVNDETNAETCAGQPTACNELYRREKIYGSDETPLIDVNRANSIEHRLIRALEALHTRFPEEGWDAYLDVNGELVWSNIVLAGFSQGAGMVGMMSRDHEVARAIFLGSGGVDASFDESTQASVLDPWSTEPRATSMERTFALLHLRDNFDAKSFVLEELGLLEFGDFERGDLESPPYRCTHALTTDLTPGQGDTSYHNSLASDTHIPVDASGIPLLAEAYFYVMVQ